jgi:hypothetical protein
MRKAAFSVLGALLIAGSAVQMATASEHHIRTGGHHHWDYRGSYNQLRDTAPLTRDGYNERREFSAPATNETRSCDVIWCYQD